jgi:hypothetical protein
MATVQSADRLRPEAPAPDDDEPSGSEEADLDAA